MIYEDRVLAFVDILGFKDMIDKSKYDEELQKKIAEAMEIIHGYKILNDRGLDGKELPEAEDNKVPKSQVTTFSDSAILSYPLNVDGALFYLMLDLIHMQMQLLWLGILMRGAIVIGKAYHDMNNAFGPAMVEAYELESKSAIYPRIILTTETFERGLDASPSFHNQYDLELMKGIVNEDNDGFLYVDYLRQNQEMDYPECYYYDWLFVIRDMLVKNLNESQMKSGVFAKYYWLLGYWNRMLNDEHLSIPVDPDLSKIERQEEYERYMRLKIEPDVVPYR